MYMNDRERQRFIALLEVRLGLFKGVAGKDDPNSVAFRADILQKLLAQLARAEKLGIRQLPEIALIESRMKYYGFSP